MSSHSIHSVLLYSLAALGLVTVLSDDSILTTTTTGLRQLFFIKREAKAPNATIFDPYPDTAYPLRDPIEPWDISIDHPYTKTLVKNVTEGTWLRIAAHPTKMEIVFDMLGDLYCMPISGGKERVHARRILGGIPYDKDASFSPSGDEIVFISDQGFGVDNIYTMKYVSCDSFPLTLSDERPSSIKQHTNSTLRFYTAPSFHPTQPQIIATKWYLTGRPNGAGETWIVPYQTDPLATPLPPHSGYRAVGRTLPKGWPVEKYFTVQVGAEQGRFAGHAGDGIVYTRNTQDKDGVFEWSKDVHKGINSIFLYNTTTSSSTRLVNANPGGANVPRLSHDGKTMAFVRRMGDKGILALRDMRSGTLHYAWDGLTWDLSTIHAPMGAYPSFGFAADDSSIIIWSEGKIMSVPLKFNYDGERISAGTPWELPFVVTISKQIAGTCYSKTNISKVELQDQGRNYALRGLRSSFDGQWVAFEAAGDTYVQKVVTGKHAPSPPAPIAIPKLHPESNYYSPFIISHTPSERLVLHARWSDTNLTSLEIASLFDGQVRVVDGVPFGRYVTPVISPPLGKHRKRKIALVRTGEDYMFGEVMATNGAGIWIGDITLGARPLVQNLTLLDSKQTQDFKLQWSYQKGELELRIEPFKILMVNEIVPIIAYKIPTCHDCSASGPQAVQQSETAVEMSLSPTGDLIAFRDYQHIWLAPAAKSSDWVWSKPSYGMKGLKRLSLDGGHDIIFSGDGEHIFWLLGPHLHHSIVASVSNCPASDVPSQCIASTIDYQEIFTFFTTDVARQRAIGKTLAITNATVFTMEDAQNDTPIFNGTIIIKNGVILEVGEGSEVSVTNNMDVHNVKGGIVSPGFIDVHGHWGGFLSLYPSKSWEMETFLAFGITTIHNPSSKNANGYLERNLIEKGSILGPRVYHTGDVLYGSTQSNVYTEIHSRQDARQALLRVKVEGGDASFSVKNYQISPRSGRQRLLQEAQKMGMIVMPEGGMNYDWCITYLLDGYSTIEHPIPIPTLYDDALSLFAATETSYTMLAVLNYGGLFAKQWVWQTDAFQENQKLRNYLRHNLLEDLSEVTQAPLNSYQVFNSSMSTNELHKRGVRINIGAHGEQPIGYLFHSEMQFHSFGGMSLYSIFRSGTINGAISLGLDDSLGTITSGKLADLVIYPPDIDSLEKWSHDTRSMQYVMRGGRLLDVTNGLIEVWPEKGHKRENRRVNPED